MLDLDVRRFLTHPRLYRGFIRAIGTESKRASYAREFVAARPNDRILDIGCGPADILEYLPKVDYHGFDMNPAYIASARRRFGERGSFYCRRVTRDAIDDLGHFDLALATGVIHHLADGEARDLFALAHKALKPGGRFVSCDGCYVPRQNPLARLLMALDRGAHVRDRAGYLRLAETAFERVTATLHDNLSRIPYTYIVLRCTR